MNVDEMSLEIITIGLKRAKSDKTMYPFKVALLYFYKLKK